MRSEKPLLSMFATSKTSEAARAVGGVEIFAAQLQVENVVRILMIRLLEFAVIFLDGKFPVVVRIREPLQMAADTRPAVPPVPSRRLRRIRPCLRRRRQSVRRNSPCRCRSREATPSRRCCHWRSERWQSSQFFVVPTPLVVWRKCRIESLTAEALGADGLLLRINPLAVRVLRTDEHGG